ncbi:chaplin [Streptomyces sp. NBC_01498]|uniref:chaplin n=1 Tax=Streptomyces sp. NBC_01498 TaxID=2975870 RepID=UPI002E7B3396|nr:chaplin [Streptomyces sp. NBC_01498]
MRQVTRKGLITVAAAGGVLALGGGHAHADSGAAGTAANSPGVLSGNNVQVPVHVPVNVCGNTVDVVGALNPAFGNGCVNASDGGAPQGGSGGGGSNGGGSQGGGSNGAGPQSGSGGGGAHAEGGAGNSPGVGSGNVVEVPVDIPVNICGNTVDVVGVLNPAFGNGCENIEPGTPEPPTEERPEEPGTPEPPTEVTPPSPNTPGTQSVDPKGTEALAMTGADGLGLAIPAGAALLLAGGFIYRRARAAA